MTAARELGAVLNEAIAAVTRAGDVIAEWSRKGSYEVREKQGTELVTSADLRSDELIRDHLQSRFPEHRFLSEEVAVRGRFNFSGPVARNRFSCDTELIGGGDKMRSTREDVECS